MIVWGTKLDRRPELSRLFSISRPIEEVVAHFGVNLSSVASIPPETV